MSWRRVGRVAGRLLLVGLLVVSARAVPWHEVVSASARASGEWLLIATLLHALILPLGTLQWMSLIPHGERIGFRTMLWIRSAGWAIANGGPFLAEHAASVHLLAKRGGVGYVAATSIKLLDQVTTGVGKLALLGAVLAAAVPLPTTLRATAAGLVVGLGALWLSLVACVGGAPRLERWAARRERSGRAVLGFLARLSRRLEVVRNPRSLGLGSSAAVLQRAAEVAACWAVVSALGGSISIGGALLVAMAVNLSTMMSITPANLGVYEGSAFVALRASGLPAEQALAAAVLLHLSYLLPIAGVGWVLLASASLLRRRRPSGSSAEAHELSGTPHHP
jgi:phosphatidylinositol alpha-mannosyltransferase